ncbi:hypothetical protein Tco_1314979 [Tanacetum coccineum]
MTPQRRRVLFTFGVLIITILQNVMQRMHISTFRKGKRAKMLHVIKQQWLSILSFFDDHILIMEYLIETLFPPSTRLFNKIDDIVKASESLPVKFDDFIDHDFPTFMQRVPFFERVFKKDEREIVIDITCHGYRVEPERSFEYENLVKLEEYNIEKMLNVSHKELKEVVEKGIEESDDDDIKEHLSIEDFSGENLFSARATSSSNTEMLQSDYPSGSNNELLQSDDPIFELFEAGWHMSPRALSTTSP